MQDQRTAKVCRKCGVEKARSDFYPARGPRANKDGLGSYCKTCATDTAKAWRKANAEHAAAHGKRYRAARVDQYREYDRARYERSPAVQLVMAAKDKPCADCGIKLPPQVMELDHVRGEKSFTIGGPRLRGLDPADVLLEIAKCDLRCPNCHRMRHFREREQARAERVEKLERDRNGRRSRSHRRSRRAPSGPEAPGPADRP